MKYVRWILITVLMNLLFDSIFTLLYAFVIKQTGNLLRDWTSLSTTILVSLSELLAAFITSAKIGKKGLLMGLSSAAIMDAVIALTSCTNPSDWPGFGKWQPFCWLGPLAAYWV